MKAHSEQKHLYDVRTHTHVAVRSVYLAAISLANSGGKITEEESLPPQEATLLEVRRKLFSNDFDSAKNLLDGFESPEPFLQGDRLFLEGQLHHRQGQQTAAQKAMNQAADLYREAGEAHRELRARVNGAMCVSTLESCLIGDIFIYEQEARRLGFNDILANIHRAKSMELLIAGQPAESAVQALAASELYRLDGYFEDNCVAIFVAAICQLLIGNTAKAQVLRAEAVIVDGKVKPYFDIYQDLVAGRVPRVPQGHSLSTVRWKKLMIKPSSISGKLISILSSGRTSRDQLITLIWGMNAIDESYCDRLYTAINALRKEKGIEIFFDGESYHL